MIKHLLLNVFVTTTGIAAFFHSTWALGTFFAGIEPQQGTWAWVWWVIPAGLIAFALDIGQISTASEIKRGHRSLSKFITFGVLAAATYYLQFLYMAHHMPSLELAAGISDSARGTAILLRDAAIWLLPALLPISTVMYTLSGGRNEVADQQPDLPIVIAGEAVPALKTEVIKSEDGTSEIIPLVTARISTNGKHADG
jgi:hypothetical protein